MEFAGESQMDTEPVRDSGEGCIGGPLRLQTSPVDFDGGLEPMTRCRANTWPCRPIDSVPDEENSSTPTSVDGDQTDGVNTCDPSVCGRGTTGVGGGTRKAAARRNAWGNLSYADLITRAIESSQEKRLTLSQIYSWMVENVPFFKDKGDSNSSAGWKNSIRHNLSLHSRFVRVQNESTGKSSWWVINPDVKNLKTPRRRAATMDNTKVALQHRRNRLKGAGLSRVSSSEHPLMGYAYESSLDHLDGSRERVSPEILSYRGRTSSNASSIGRLSPIPASAEQDLDETQFGIAPLTSSALSWNELCLPAEGSAETLSESLASIFVEDAKKPIHVGESCHGNIMSPNGSMAQNGNIVAQNGNLMAQSGSIMAPNRVSVMAPNGINVMNQNGGNVLNHSNDVLGHNKNGAIIGMHPSYPPNMVNIESPSGVPLSFRGQNMWSVYHAHKPTDGFPSASIPGPRDVRNKLGRYDGDPRFAIPTLMHTGMAYYNENGGHAVPNMCHSPDMRYARFGVPNVSGTAPQYGSPLCEILKKEPKSVGCFYPGSNGDPAGDVRVSSGMIGVTSPPPPVAIKTEQTAKSFPSGTQWQDQQQQKSPQQPNIGRSLGPIDPQKLMKILTEKPHLKEKMLQLIQQKRQQLAFQIQHQQQEQKPKMNCTTRAGGISLNGTPPNYLSAPSCMAENSDPKRNTRHPEECLNSRSPFSNGSLPTTMESLMPVDLDLDFDTTPAINCDINEVIQHELTFGELDFSLDQLQVHNSGNNMDYNSFHF